MGTFLVIIAIYMLPTITVAFNTHKKSKAPTVVINMFLGWTFIGWIIAFAMSVGRD